MKPKMSAKVGGGNFLDLCNVFPKALYIPLIYSHQQISRKIKLPMLCMAFKCEQVVVAWDRAAMAKIWL